MTVYDEITANVRKLLRKHDMTQIELARRMYVDPNALSKRLYGKQKWTIEDVMTVAGVFNMDPCELLMKRPDTLSRPVPRQ